MPSKLCLYVFLAVLVFNLLIITIWLAARPDPGFLPAKDALEEIKKSGHLADKIFAFLVYLTRFIGQGLFGLVLLMSAAAFSCLASICAADTVEVLKVIRLMLQDLFAFLDRG
jgi:hypothetical protein